MKNPAPRLEDKMKKPHMPASEATEAEREKYRNDMARFLDKHRGVELNARGLEQERDLIMAMSLSPTDQKRHLTAQTERIRNKLGRDFEIIFNGAFLDPSKGD
jgi:hypothetical protein